MRPVALAALAPPHVTLKQIFAGMMPFPGIGLCLLQVPCK